MGSDWLGKEELDAMRRNRLESADSAFRKQFIGRWGPLKKRCEHKSLHDQCPNEARFRVIIDGSEDSNVICDVCLVPVLIQTKVGTATMVIKL